MAEPIVSANTCPTDRPVELEVKAQLLTELLFLMAVRTCPQLSAAQRIAANMLALNGVALPGFPYGAMCWEGLADALIREGYIAGDRSNYDVTDKGRKRMGELLMEAMNLGIGVNLEC